MPDPYIIGDSSPFLKRVLVPFWVIRIIIMLVEIAIYGLAVGVIAAYTDDDDYRLEEDYNVGQVRGTVIAVLCVIMVLILICLILDIVCIVKRSRRTLSPRFFLIVNVLQTTLWVIFFILSMIGARTGLSIGIAVIIFLSFLGLLIYSSVVFHQFRKGKLGSGGKYQPAFNPSIAVQTPQPYAGGESTMYAGSYETPKPVHYGDIPAPTQPGYGQQPAYGYELPNRTV